MTFSDPSADDAADGGTPPSSPPSPRSYVLRASPDSFRSTKILIAAQYSGACVTVPSTTSTGGDHDPFPDATDADAARRSPSGRLPVLEVPPCDGEDKGAAAAAGGGAQNSSSAAVLFGSNAIARYIARAGCSGKKDGGPHASLLGGDDPLRMALVDGWIDFATNEVEVPASVWVYPVLGRMIFRESAYKKAKADLGTALASLNRHLLYKTYLVGDTITLADIAVVTALLHPFTLVCDSTYLEPYGNVVRWFTTCVRQPQFEAVVGTTEMCREEKLFPGRTKVVKGGATTTAAVAKKRREKKKKTKKKKKPHQRQDGSSSQQAEGGSKDGNKPPATAAAPKKSAEHPYRLLDRTSPSPFSLDAWKRTYSNAPITSSSSSDGGRASVAMMDTFWKLYDRGGWSLWYQTYEHDEEENDTKLFITSNRISGFMQRTDSIKRWAFGVMHVLGTEQGEDGAGGGGDRLEVRGVWLLRGDTVDVLLDANDDAQWYTWKKLAGTGLPLPTDDVKKIVAEYWCSSSSSEEEDGEIEDKTIQDTKVFK